MSHLEKVLLLGVDGLIPELVDRFCDEGALPNIQRLRDEGTTTRLMPYISTWGDTNFVTFLSGQAPGNSWVGQRMPPRDTRHLLELMNEAGKKCALVHFPESLVPTGEHDLCLAPYWSGQGPAPMELASAGLHTSDPAAWPEVPQHEALGWPPSGTLAHHQKHNRLPIERSAGEYHAAIRLNGGGSLPVTLTPEGDGRVSLSLDAQHTTLDVGEWSGWLPVDTAHGAGQVRFKLLAHDIATGRLDLLQSQITIPEQLSNQPALADRLIRRHGPFIAKWAVSADPDTLYHETSFEEGRYQLEWLVDSALTLLDEEDFSLFATVFRLNDETHHTCLAYCDPASPFFSATRQAEYLEAIRCSYRLLDDAVGRLLAGCREDTLLVLASDHGDVPNHYLCDIHRRLAEFDLCTLDDRGRPVIERSRAFLKDERGGLEIFVNRDLVAVPDVADVQTRILKALTTWYVDTPAGERNVVALAVKGEDAGILGYWGEHRGDVLFAYASGFVWGVNRRGDTVAPVQSAGANHGPQIPSASTDFASNLGLAIFHGSGVRAGQALPANGLRRMDDPGATFARVLGLETATLDGKPLDILGESRAPSGRPLS
ncbi:MULTISPECIES: alkaline phosphatase family protein [unclassified Modicisalibacter]|uniref:alkaline phosphatase family protein n=1 Tax=unclassified Modicisalibacter TaxID=2679913 RepID=UPI001CCB3763|nr:MULTISPECIES: alkaline phosphatase family protein [unclassified Modicisalibacter]MBZ9558619.1 alkaline phosphatase family protein [Modicisalibacter sp. R2A 31.J]MBZ9575489.1 alkaline phosphatase family protein [Modicisalibacter sp. MOD 31.J]